MVAEVSVSGSSPWKRGLLPAAATAVIVFGAIGVCVGFPCASTGLRYGLWLARCPATDLRLEVEVSASGLVRGGRGTLDVHAQALWLDGAGVEAVLARRPFTRGAEVEATLLGVDEAPVDGLILDGFTREGTRLRSGLRLPDLPDGDYVLRTQVTTAFESRTVDLDLPLYKPALVHLMSDRPLYKPGQDVLLRSVSLERSKRTPLDGRPGRWRIVAPDGTEMHVERAKAGAFGVAETSFPLDRHADIGTWRASYESGGARDEITFEVRPFRLPRFTVELSSSERWFGVGDRVVIEGVARYTSGAPVAEAPVELTVRQSSGRWPAPLAWEEPVQAHTRSDGTFEVEIGDVPADLIERSTFSVSARVTEQAGEAASGATQLVVSKDDLQVEAVTELGDGLVEGFNNRLYVRVSTPDGRPLPLAEVTVGNPWDDTWKPREAKADVDAVFAVQLDPGKPVTVVDPTPPVRVRPMVPDAPHIQAANEQASGRGLDLAERRALDAVYGDIAACGDLTVGNRTVTLGMRVDRAGGVRDLVHDGSALAACASDATRRVRFPVGEERTWSLSWMIPDSLRPSLRVDVRTAWGDASDLSEPLAEATLAARRCLAVGAGIDGVHVFDVHWRRVKGSSTVALQPEVVPGSGLSPAALACLGRNLSRLNLDEPASGDALGVVKVHLSVPRPASAIAAGPATRTAYELRVAARSAEDGAPLGDTRLVLPVGAIPPMRLRATPSIVHPGEEVTVELFRGPDFFGDLPETLPLRHGTRSLVEGRLDGNKVTYRVPEDGVGFLHVEHAGARVVIFSTPAAPLALSMSTDATAYRPGETATLTVTTTQGRAGTPAAVALVGVDQALGQLAPLLGPDDWGRVTVRATAERPAFGSFDPRALTLGQVRGEAAAQAAVLRIGQIPMDHAGDVAVGATAAGAPDTLLALTEAFYRALARLVPKVRAWEGTAPEAERMQPARMVDFWNAALEDLRAEGNPAVDAFGRELTLDLLPPDLLAQVDPRQIVANGTRLPEDMLSWTRYVAEEVAR